MLTGNNLFFICLALAAFAFILFLLLRERWTKSNPLCPTSQIALALLASGILGNVTDRILRGAVTDFLNFYYRGNYWPSFNVADSCICIAAGLMILLSLRKSEPKRMGNKE
jgi:signal peptidase II